MSYNVENGKRSLKSVDTKHEAFETDDKYFERKEVKQKKATVERLIKKQRDPELYEEEMDMFDDASRNFPNSRGRGASLRRPKGSWEVPLRVVHLDLKGAPPKMKYLQSVLPLLALSGANAILIEYEDMFPYTDTLRNLSAHNAYTMDQVRALLKTAARLHLEVIPLVQTFGHLEFALKLAEFRHLRELDAFPQEVCPSNPHTFQDLVREMVRQVMVAHPDIRYLHIGCDEVFHLGACSACSKRRKEPRVLFTEHVSLVAGHIRAEYYGVTPLIWDDMMRRWTQDTLRDSGLGDLVEPVVWVYADDISRLIPHYVWFMYGKVFPRVWVAGAFKGAYGETAVVPDLRKSYDNHVAWLKVLHSTRAVQQFQAVVLTGWSRYDHFAVLCELLPVSIPSLILNLLLISEEKKLTEGGPPPQVFHKWTNSLSCTHSRLKITHESLVQDRYQWELSSCSFPGSNMYSIMATYMSLRARVEDMFSELTDKQGWLTPYNVRHNFSSPWRLMTSFFSFQANGEHLIRELKDLRELVTSVMTQYYDNHTIDEWIEQKVDPLMVKMLYLEKSVNSLTARNTWPRRPLK
uniref:beta-N-acetylhexosaminidase n=1 Tax=Timema genevievae TaxID=629358 RepID=A0A7R9JSD9_TIMGE|nr:unnamed protein product [Timema genevievae]